MQGRTSRKKKAWHCGFIWVKREGSAEGREGAVNEVLGQSVRETMVGHSPVREKDVLLSKVFSRVSWNW